MPEHVLALDVGTTSARAMVVAPDGTVASVAVRPIFTAYPAPDRAEQDADAIWRLVLTVIGEALALARRTAADVAAIGVTTQRASIVVWHPESGVPLAPMVLWSDMSGGTRSRELRQAGFPNWPQTPACKLEAVLARAGTGAKLWGGLDSFLVYRLSGCHAHVTDLSSAWLSGLVNYQALKGWNSRLLAYLNLDEQQFPRIVDSWGDLARTSASVVGAEIPITALVADQQGAMFAHGALDAGCQKATFGTSGVVMTGLGETPQMAHTIAPPQVLCSHAGRTLFCVEGMVVTAGSAIDWLGTGLGLFPSAKALCEAAATVQNAGGVTIRPSFQGLGTPHGHLEKRGLFAGLHLGTRREHLARAVLDGLAYRTREIVDAFATNSCGSSLGVDGGLSASDAFLQILANALGQPVRRLAVREGTAYGAALAAMLGAGLLQLADLKSRARYAAVFDPEIPPDQISESYASWRDTVYELL